MWEASPDADYVHHSVFGQVAEIGVWRPLPQKTVLGTPLHSDGGRGGANVEFRRLACCVEQFIERALLNLKADALIQGVGFDIGV